MNAVQLECIPVLLIPDCSPRTIQDPCQGYTQDTKENSAEGSCQVKILLFTLDIEGDLVCQDSKEDPDANRQPAE